MDNIIPQKQCTRCKQYKPLEDFLATERVRKKTGLKGRKSRCRKCVSELAHERYQHENLTPEQIEVRRIRYRDYNNNRRSPDSDRVNRLKRIYGMCESDYYKLLEEQQGCCAICKRSCQFFRKDSQKEYKLNIDHCHKTGAVRALLCGKCNMAFGMLEEDPDRIQALLDYAKKWHMT